MQTGGIVAGAKAQQLDKSLDIELAYSMQEVSTCRRLYPNRVGVVHHASLSQNMRDLTIPTTLRHPDKSPLIPVGAHHKATSNEIATTPQHSVDDAFSMGSLFNRLTPR